VVANRLLDAEQGPAEPVPAPAEAPEPRRRRRRPRAFGIGLVALLLGAVAAFGVSVAGDDEPDRNAASVVPPTSIRRSPPTTRRATEPRRTPTLEVVSRPVTDLRSCRRAGGQVVFSGTVRNPDAAPRDYVVRAAFRDASGKTVDQGTARLTDVRPGSTAPWTIATAKGAQLRGGHCEHVTTRVSSET
jgi:hypothetical protein